MFRGTCSTALHAEARDVDMNGFSRPNRDGHGFGSLTLVCRDDVIAGGYFEVECMRAREGLMSNRM